MAREIYYVLESICTATEENENFSGEIHLRYIGKENKTLFCEGTHDAWLDQKHLWTPYFVRQYGYKRKCDARRNWSFTHPENSKAWKEKVRVVRVWVRKDGQLFVE